jgi:hypothetical protein
MEKSRAYKENKEGALQGRYLHTDMLVPLISKLSKSFQVDEAGKSVRGVPIEKISLGTGPVKVLMWSQMHGNESTTTKALFDLLNTFGSHNSRSRELLQALTIVIIPMLNPDGARAYTRENANGIDLNRDARDLTQPESRVLRKVYEEFAPEICFNLHDQRTIFSAGSSPSPATISFLAPAADPARNITASRLKAMSIINSMNRELTREIPGQIGRYDDGFNPNCVGDTFQMLRTPTILIEAGHFPEDYQREYTRKYVFTALWSALENIAFEEFDPKAEKGYSFIPENEKRFFDILVRNVNLLIGDPGQTRAAGILFREELSGNEIRFTPYIEKQGSLADFYGHRTFDCAIEESLEELRKLKDVLNLFNI